MKAGVTRLKEKKTQNHCYFDYFVLMLHFVLIEKRNWELEEDEVKTGIDGIYEWRKDEKVQRKEPSKNGRSTKKQRVTASAEFRSVCPDLSPATVSFAHLPCCEDSHYIWHSQETQHIYCNHSKQPRAELCSHSKKKNNHILISIGHCTIVDRWIKRLKNIEIFCSFKKLFFFFFNT